LCWAYFFDGPLTSGGIAEGSCRDTKPGYHASNRKRNRYVKAAPAAAWRTWKGPSKPMILASRFFVSVLLGSQQTRFSQESITKNRNADPERSMPSADGALTHPRGFTSAGQYTAQGHPAEAISDTEKKTAEPVDEIAESSPSCQHGTSSKQIRWCRVEHSEMAQMMANSLARGRISRGISPVCRRFARPSCLFLFSSFSSFSLPFPPHNLYS